MPKGRVLSLAERETIAEMHRAGASGREIAKKLERSKTVVLNFLRDPAQYGQIKRSGRKRALSTEDERRLYVALFRQPPPPAVARERERERERAEEEEDEQARMSAALEMSLDAAAVLSTTKSAEQIKREFNLPLSVRRIQQLLSEWRKLARRQVDSHAVGTSDDATESEDVTSPTSEAAEHMPPRQARPSGLGGEQPTAADARQAASDAISSADAMLALPDEKLDSVLDSAPPPAADAPRLGEESCLSSLSIDDTAAFPELQLSLSDDKLPGGTPAAMGDGPRPSPAASEAERLSERVRGDQRPRSPAAPAHVATSLTLPAGVLDSFATSFTN